MLYLRAFAAGLILLVVGCTTDDATKEPTSRSLLILHTNDIHDHVRPGDAGVGGMPYLSGYVARVRAENPDILLLDAGDGAHKGDLVAFLTRSEITYEAMGRMAYDALAVGNHEHNLGLDQVRRFNTLTGDRMLAVNLIDGDGRPLLAPTRIVEVAGIRVGLIGMALSRNRDTLDFDASGEALAQHTRRLQEEDGVELLIAVVHVGIEDAERWSQLAPEVDVFITGHTHRPLQKPVVFESTGAIAVQAESNARSIGRLELLLDESGRIIDHQGELLAMRHDRIEPDGPMLDWILATEAELYPGADTVVTELDEPLGWFAIARLGAEAIRRKANAEIGLYHPTHVVRNILPPGPITVNMLFRTTSDRGHDLVVTELTGAEIEAYLNGVARRDYRAFGLTQWAGFSVDVQLGDEHPELSTDLEADRRYRVALTQREWENRFLRLTERLDADEREGPLAHGDFQAEDAGFVFVDALREHIAGLEVSLHDHLDDLVIAQGDPDPWEAELAPGILERLLGTTTGN